MNAINNTHSFIHCIPTYRYSGVSVYFFRSCFRENVESSFYRDHICAGQILHGEISPTFEHLTSSLLTAGIFIFKLLHILFISKRTAINFSVERKMLKIMVVCVCHSALAASIEHRSRSSPMCCVYVRFTCFRERARALLHCKAPSTISLFALERCKIVVCGYAAPLSQYSKNSCCGVLYSSSF